MFAFVKNNSIINFDYLGEKTIPKDTPIITITIKRKTIKWKQLVRENVFKKLEGEEEDASSSSPSSFLNTFSLTSCFHFIVFRFIVMVIIGVSFGIVFSPK